MTLLEARSVAKAYRQGGLFDRRAPLAVLEEASISIAAGECVALLGSSGSGKSTLGRLLLGLERPDSGSVLFRGEPLLGADGRVSHASRRALQAVFQDPHGATNARFTAAAVIAEPLRHLTDLGERAIRERVRELMAEVRLDPNEALKLAHRFSGGQLQRLCIARALAPDPELIVLDEAVSSLDLTTQSGILDLLGERRSRRGTAYLFVTHDIRLIHGFADRLFVMAGRRPVEITDENATGEAADALALLEAAVLPALPPGLDAVA